MRGVFPSQPDRAVRCGLTGVTRVEVRLGDGDDGFSSSHPIPVGYEGGRGDDSFFGDAPRVGTGGHSRRTSEVRFRGGAGRDLASYQTELGDGISMSADDQANDGRRFRDRDDVGSDVEVFRGSPGAADFIVGTGDGDVFHASDGADTILGLGGDDVFEMGPAPRRADPRHRRCRPRHGVLRRAGRAHQGRERDPGLGREHRRRGRRGRRR